MNRLRLLPFLATAACHSSPLVIPPDFTTAAPVDMAAARPADLAVPSLWDLTAARTCSQPADCPTAGDICCLISNGGSLCIAVPDCSTQGGLQLCATASDCSGSACCDEPPAKHCCQL
jgi:hypothetical protein